MNSVDRSTVLHCLKSMIDEEVCEECPLYGMTGTDHCEKDCVRLAINALEQESCTDAVSRQAVLDLAKFDGRENLGSIIHAFDVEQLPPVTPAEKVGQWEWEQESFTKNWGNWHCSKCREIITVCETDWAKINKPNYKYCPNCGTKMQGVEE